MSAISRLLVLVGIVLVGVRLSSCAVGSSTTTRTVDDFEQEVSVGTSYSVHGNEPDAWLEKSRQHAREGRYDEARDLLRRVYRAPNADDDQKATALLELGQLHLNVLNPNRSDLVAAEYFVRLMDEFPDSEQAQAAEDRLVYIDAAE